MERKIPNCFRTNATITQPLGTSVKGHRDSGKGNNIGTDTDTGNNMDTYNNRHGVAGGIAYWLLYLEKK